MSFKSSQSNANTTSEPYHPSITNGVGIAYNRAPAARLRAACPKGQEEHHYLKCYLSRGMAPQSPTINQMPFMGVEISRVE